MNDVRILLADDHRLFRHGIRQILESRQGFTVVAEAENGFDAVRLYQTNKPDIVLMDISMPQLNGLDATRRIVEEFPSARIVILSMHLNRRYVSAALQAGVKGYLLKDSAPDELLQAINRVMTGRFFLSAGVNEQVILDYIKKAEVDPQSPFSLLSPREREVLQLLAEGNTTKGIADRLNLSSKTVETHRAHLMEKLNLFSIAELTKYAIREGLVALE